MTLITSNQPLPGVTTRHCAHCGGSFNTCHPNHYYCSVGCRRAAGPKSQTLASALSILAEPVAGAPAGLEGLGARIDKMDPAQQQAMLQHTGQLLRGARV